MDTHRLQKLDIDYTVYIKHYKSQTYTLQSLLQTTKIRLFVQAIHQKSLQCSLFALQQSVVSTFLIQNLQWALFYYKVYTVHFLRLQKFVVHASLFQSLSCGPFHYKFCCLCFFRLQKLVVCPFKDYKSLQSAFLTFSLQCP